MNYFRGNTLGLAMLALLGTAVVTGCGDGASNQDGDVAVVATTTILGDLVSNIVGPHASIEVLLPLGADPHDYQASARQVAAIQEADLVVGNGLGLEDGLRNVLAAAAADGANVVELGELLDPLPRAGSTLPDPHFWLDPLRMATAAGVIATELAAVDAAVDWTARADEYVRDLLAAHEEVELILQRVAPSDRKLVTNHDALGYWAERYQFEVVGTVIPGGATLAIPSSAALADLVATIDGEGVRAIFVESSESPALAEAVAAEVGRDIAVVELFTGSLGEPGSSADSLIGLMLTNARRVAAALA